MLHHHNRIRTLRAPPHRSPISTASPAAHAAPISLTGTNFADHAKRTRDILPARKSKSIACRPVERRIIAIRRDVFCQHPVPHAVAELRKISSTASKRTQRAPHLYAENHGPRFEKRIDPARDQCSACAHVATPRPTPRPGPYHHLPNPDPLQPLPPRELPCATHQSGWPPKKPEQRCRPKL